MLWLKTHVLSMHNRHTHGATNSQAFPHKRQAEARALEGPERPRPGGPRASLPFTYFLQGPPYSSHSISVISLGL